MNKGIIVFLLMVILVCSVGLYLLRYGPSLFVRSPQEERMAYISTAGGNEDLWTMKWDGTDRRQLTQDAATERSPCWSPDAVEVAYVSNHDKNVFQVFVAAWDGAYVKQLTKATGAKDVPKWKKDGTRLAFIAAGRIFSIPRHGGTEEQVYPPVATGFDELTPPITWVDWAPKGSVLAFASDADQYQLLHVLEDPDRKPIGVTKARRLSAAWSPVDQKLAVAFIGRGNDNGILVADLERVYTEDIWLSKDSARGPGVLNWSPDGKTIAFELWDLEEGLPKRSVGICVKKPGSQPKLIVRGDCRNPVWSSTGEYLAFERFRDDGCRDIWRVRADGSEPTNLTRGEGDNSQPAWSPAVKKK